MNRYRRGRPDFLRPFVPFDNLPAEESCSVFPPKETKSSHNDNMTRFLCNSRISLDNFPHAESQAFLYHFSRKKRRNLEKREMRSPPIQFVVMEWYCCP